MEKVILISLSGSPMKFKASQEAYNTLSQYLDRARTRLSADPDRDEVMRDLEQSIGAKLAPRTQNEETILEVGDINAVLAEVGPVDTGSGDPSVAQPAPRGKRRLVRIKEGQDILGICQGLSAYSDIDVDWLRFIFLALAAVTGGIFILVYFTAGFFLPVVATREEYFAMYGQNTAH
jgi:phage shock protein C